MFRSFFKIRYCRDHKKQDSTRTTHLTVLSLISVSSSTLLDPNIAAPNPSEPNSPRIYKMWQRHQLASTATTLRLPYRSQTANPRSRQSEKDQTKLDFTWLGPYEGAKAGSFHHLYLENIKERIFRGRLAYRSQKGEKKRLRLVSWYASAVPGQVEKDDGNFCDRQDGSLLSNSLPRVLQIETN